jgi:hypothetical protein
MNQSFFNQYKVVILGCLSAIALALYDLTKTGETSTKVLVFAGALALTSFLANNLRGQWASIAGIVGTAITTYVTMDQQGAISWSQLILQLVVAMLAVAAPPPKSRGYEHTATISNARYDGERKAPTVLGKK